VSARLAVCRTCGNCGPVPATGVPAWCTCTGTGGPYNAPPGTVVQYTFETREAVAFRERCRLAANAERVARDVVTRVRWDGAVGRPRRFTHPLVREAVRVYAEAARSLEILQAQCPHPSRSPYAPEHCDACAAQVQCGVEDHRARATSEVLRVGAADSYRKAR
jgi:hypothetical protein